MSKVQEVNVLPDAPQQGRRAAATAFVRIFVGVLWLFEVTVGGNWKIGTFSSGLNPEWFGPEGGSAVSEQIAGAVEDGTWAWPAWVFQNFAEPNAALFAFFVTALQVLLGVAFISGAFVRPVAVLAIAFDLTVFFLGSWRLPTFFFLFHLFLLYSNAGRYYGLDALIVPKLQAMRGQAGRLLHWVNTLPILKSPRLHSALFAVAVLASAYFFMEILGRPTERMGLVAMDLAVVMGLVAAGLYFGRQPGRDHFTVVTALLRVYVGYKLLHQTLVWSPAGINALPGGSPLDEVTELFETIAANHWAPIAGLVNGVILPAIGFWLVVFTVVQLAAGAMLVAGYRTQMAAAVTVAYLGTLIGMGFLRLAPFLLVVAIAMLVLDSGRNLSLDSAGKEERPPRYLPLLPAGQLGAAVAAVVALLFVVVTLAVGLAPGDYTEEMRTVMTSMAAMFVGIPALVSLMAARSAGAGAPPPPEAATESKKTLTSNG